MVGNMGNIFEKVWGTAKEFLGAKAPKAEEKEAAANGEYRGFTKKKHNIIPENNLFSISSSEIERKTHENDITPTGIKEFDQLIKDGGLEQGSSILISGGTGTGKTTFILQSMHNCSKERSLKCIYISFEEDPKKIKGHMKKNYGWDFEALEKSGTFAIVKVDPLDVARDVEQIFLEKHGELKIRLEKIRLPFLPDIIAQDSLSALSIAFTEEENYRKYITELFQSLVHMNCISYVISETEQDPRIYSRTGVEEFLADGVIVLYNLKKQGKRENEIEVLKLRSSSHHKGRVPYRITTKGILIGQG